MKSNKNQRYCIGDSCLLACEFIEWARRKTLKDNIAPLGWNMLRQGTIKGILRWPFSVSSPKTLFFMVASILILVKPHLHQHQQPGQIPSHFAAETAIKDWHTSATLISKHHSASIDSAYHTMKAPCVDLLSFWAQCFG